MVEGISNSLETLTNDYSLMRSSKALTSLVLFLH